MSHTYAEYSDIDQEQLQKDIEEVKNSIGDPTEEDFQHLLRMERWTNIMSFLGYAIMVYVGIAGSTGFAFWSLAIVAAILLGIANVGRWANVAHPVLHGAYDKVPNVPYEYTKEGFAKGKFRYFQWLDWITPDAWKFEHNVMHHYHLGEDDDPDNVERNMQWLIKSKTPMWARYAFVALFAGTWKLTYYAPNTLRILENKERRRKKLPELRTYDWSPFTKNGKELWVNYILPYAILNFVIIPLCFLPLGWTAVGSALIIKLMAEYVANIHSFMVIVPNHSAEDIYQFSTPHKTQGEFYLRQIMGSVNYTTGTDPIDFAHGWLNYQVEHHMFPNIPLSQYQKMQPVMKEICKKHNLEYRQENVFKRVLMTADLMVGKTKLLKIEGV
jgi:fatty acid desaturase